MSKSTTTDKRFKFSQFLLTFAIIYLGTQIFMRVLFPETFSPDAQVKEVTLRAADASVKGGHYPELIVHNKTDDAFSIASRCPMPPVDVLSVLPSGKLEPQTSQGAVSDCDQDALEVASGQRVKISLAPWKEALFGQYGEYEVRLTEQELSTRFEIYEPGAFTKLFRAFVTKPLLNALIFIASLFADKSLGWAVIILTLIVKLILFFPTQHAMEGQKKLQALQPKLEEIKKKFKDKPEQMNKEIMALWKKNNVNPMQSCLPILIQFPILIGLFFVIRDGSNLELSRHLMYTVYQGIEWNFGTDFFGLDLLVPSKFLMPPALVIMQFLQLKLSFAIAKKKKGDEPKKDSKEPLSQQEIQQRFMLYGLPIMIGVFAFQFPAAVSLYWLVSTLFAIGQQVVVNRKELV